MDDQEFVENLGCVLLSLHGKPYFLFPDVLKRWSFQKNCAGIWSFLYYRERWYFFFPKIWSYTLDGKWKMIFLKKYTEIWYFLQTFWKDGLSRRGRTGTWSFLHYLERWYFSRKHDLFSLGRKWKTTLPRKYMETWCIAQQGKTGNLIGSKFGLSLNLFSWRYSTMNNLQYFVPSSPQDPCFGACLSANKGNHLSIRG